MKLPPRLDYVFYQEQQVGLPFVFWRNWICSMQSDSLPSWFNPKYQGKYSIMMCSRYYAHSNSRAISSSLRPPTFNPLLLNKSFSWGTVKESKSSAFKGLRNDSEEMLPTIDVDFRTIEDSNPLISLHLGGRLSFGLLSLSHSSRIEEELSSGGGNDEQEFLNACSQRSRRFSGRPVFDFSTCQTCHV